MTLVRFSTESVANDTYATATYTVPSWWSFIVGNVYTNTVNGDCEIIARVNGTDIVGVSRFVWQLYSWAGNGASNNVSSAKWMVFLENDVVELKQITGWAAIITMCGELIQSTNFVRLTTESVAVNTYAVATYTVPVWKMLVVSKTELSNVYIWINLGVIITLTDIIARVDATDEYHIFRRASCIQITSSQNTDIAWVCLFSKWMIFDENEVIELKFQWLPNPAQITLCGQLVDK